MEPLDFLFDLLWVNLCLAILQLLILIPGHREEMALLKKSLEVGHQLLISPRHWVSGICYPVHLSGHLLDSPGQPVQPLHERSRVEPGPLPRWPQYLNNLCECLLLPLLPSSQRHCDLLRLALFFVRYWTQTSNLWPLTLLFEPCTLHARALLGLFWVPFALSFVLRTADTPARKLIKNSKG